MKQVTRSISSKTQELMMPAALVAMFDEHRYLHRMLDILQCEVAPLGRGQQADIGCISTVFDYIRHYPDCYHHPKENLLLDKLSFAPELRAVIAQLKRDHREIDALGSDVAGLLERAGDSRSRRQRRRIATKITTYIVRLRKHIQLEESKLFAPATERLTPSDWQAIDQQIAVIDDPVFGELPLEQYQMLFDRYLNSFYPVSTGSLSPVVIETSAAAVERSVATAVAVSRLPGQLLKQQLGVANSQWDSLKSLLSVRDVETAAKVLSSTCQQGLQGAKHSLALVSDALLDPEPGNDSDMQSKALSQHSEQLFAEFVSPAGGRDTRAQISWQAMVINLMLRATIKPWMTYAGLDAAIKAKNTGFLRGKVPAGVIQQDLDHPSFKARWVRPEGQASSRQTLLYLPGGAFIFPAVSAHTAMLANILEKTGCQGLIVDYRLAPEHPFPAGLEDAIAAYLYLLEEQSIAPQDIVIAGDSAGGGLVMSLLVALRDRHIALPKAAALLSPLADLSFSGPSRDTNRWRDAMLPAKRKMQSFALYHGDLPVDSPLISPVFADLSGLPPLFVQVSSSEILLDDSLRLAHKARQQGVEVSVEVWQSLPHVWQLWPQLPETEQALTRIAEFFNQQLQAQEQAAG